MADTYSSAQTILERRLTFLHSMKGAILSAQKLPERKGLIARRLCYFLFNESLLLQLSEDDMPDAESRRWRTALIRDGYHALALRSSVDSVSCYIETKEERDEIVAEFYDDMVEVADRALLCYEQMAERVKSYRPTLPASSASPAV